MDKQIFQLLSALRAGAHLETALAYDGQSPSIFGLWLLLGGPRTMGRFVPFARALSRAVTEAEVRNIALISKAAEKDWRAGAWLLQHRFPDRWGGKTPTRQPAGATLAAGLCMRKLGEISGQKALDRPRQRESPGHLRNHR